MLYSQAVEPRTLELLNDLMQKKYLRQYILVGGTALALQIGHRQSDDLDLFTITDFKSDDIIRVLLKNYDLKLVLQMPQTVICEINNIKVDFIRFNYPFIRPILTTDGIRMLSIEDIAPMKLDAITGRGSKKDFFDLYFLLQLFDIDKLLTLYQEKYPHQTTFHIVRSLTYFADAEAEPDPLVLNGKVTWEKVKKNIQKAVRKI